jgi:glycosyltransferase involved in cell wall biosynthesis
MRAGRPVIATRVGGVHKMTGPDGALLVPPGDPAALAQAIDAVLGDQQLAARLGEQALARSASLPAVADAVSAAMASYELLPEPSAGAAG